LSSTCDSFSNQLNHVGCTQLLVYTIYVPDLGTLHSQSAGNGD